MQTTLACCGEYAPDNTTQSHQELPQRHMLLPDCHHQRAGVIFDKDAGDAVAACCMIYYPLLRKRTWRLISSQVSLLQAVSLPHLSLSLIGHSLWICLSQMILSHVLMSPEIFLAHAGDSQLTSRGWKVDCMSILDHKCAKKNFRNIKSIIDLFYSAKVRKNKAFLNV